jgi:hypothetical protein
MSSIRRQILTAVWVLFVVAASARGEDYSDPSGFTFTYPEGWVVVNREKIGDAGKALPAEIRNWVAKNKVDLSQVAVILLRNGEDAFLENLNVVVDKQEQIPVTDSTVKELTNKLPKQYESMGIKVGSLFVRIQKVGDREAIVADYTAESLGGPTLRQKQVMFPGGGKTYIVTCTTTFHTNDQYQPILNKVLASFKMPEPEAFDMSRTLNYALIGGAIGGLVGGLTWVMKKLSRRDDADE